jgi:uncharacterized membrane protein
VSLYEWLLFLHVLSAFAVVAAMVLFTYVVVAGRAVDVPSEAVRLFHFSRLGEVLVNVGMVGVLVLGVWLAIDADEYQLWDGWIIAAFVLWAVFAELGRRLQKIYNAARDRARELAAAGDDVASPELNVMLRSGTGLALQVASIAVILGFLVDMIYKPGA